jgi:serine/threonine-protein phosphatase 2B regulatory subunit
LKKLKREFDNIDVDGSGEIDMNEFFEFVTEPKNVFSTALFSLIDTDGSGNISFEEFVACIGSYCMFTKDEILQFIFDVYDEDRHVL